MLTNYETSESIVAGINQGDPKAESAMVEKYGRALIYLLEKRTGDRERAKDILQDTFLVVLQKLRIQPIAEPSKLSAYLHSTAINLLIGQIRKETRRKTTADTELLSTLAITEGDQYLAIVRERSNVAVRKIIDDLQNERDRKILTLYYIEDSDKEMVCQELDLSHRHFDRVISRARSRFRELVEDRLDEIPMELTT